MLLCVFEQDVESVAGLGMIWVEFEYLAVLLDCLVCFALLGEEICPIVKLLYGIKLFPLREEILKIPAHVSIVRPEL